MYAKTTTLFTTTILWLVFYGLSTSPVLAKLSPGSSQGIPSNADTEVGLSETETLKAVNQGTDISQVQTEPPALPALPAEPSTPEPPTLPAPETTAPETTAPTVTPASPNQNVPGIINSLSTDGTSVEIKIADGSFKTYPLSPNLVNSSELVKGAFVNLLVDNNLIVQGVQRAVEESTIRGIVRGIDGNLVTLQLPNGELTTTTVAPAVSARMGLVPGTPLTVTSYRGISSTKLCFGETNPPPLPPVIQQPPITPPPRVAPRPTPPPRPRPRPPRRSLW